MVSGRTARSLRPSRPESRGRGRWPDRARLCHRLWPESRLWGFPTGAANKGERHEDTIAREVRGETGLSVNAGRLLKVRGGYQYRIEVYYEATLIGGLALDPKECIIAGKGA